MAKPFVRRAFKFFFVTLNIIVVIFFLLACLCPYLNPAEWWVIGFMGLLFPYLTLVLLLLIIFWFIVKPRIAWISIITLVIGYQQISVAFGRHPARVFVKNKEVNTFRIINWNVQSFNGISKNKEAKKLVRNDIEKSIEAYDPDIICLQEFNTSSITGEQSDNIALFSKKFPYYFFSADYERSKGMYKSGCIIFSKSPIIFSEKVKFPVAESLIYADIVKGKDTIRVFTTHLQSYKFKKEDYESIDNISSTNDAAVLASMNVFRKMKLAFKRRGAQVDIVKNVIVRPIYPSVICGDFNDVPNSYTYFNIRGDRQDAFLEKQLGFGKTFIGLAPTLRIDYMLPDNNFNILQCELVDENLSDHLMLVTDLQIKK